MDNPPQVDKGGTHAERHAEGPASPSIPAGLDRGRAGHQGNEKRVETPVEVNPQTPSQAGKAKYAGEPHWPAGGGSEHQT